ncbi:MAG: TonB-dependent receptor [Opitutaceae bacterium]|jgi:hypothetical protein
MSEHNALLTTNRKALTINLDDAQYGTFAEIGAGQEVARLFFQAGGAAGTVAKSISAYDMAFSDAIYGKAPRYVSRERLQTMLDHEYALLLERLSDKRGERTCFFVFADTVAAKSFKGNNECHGWMGVRFQSSPCSESSEILIHVRMWDKENVLQQQALGIVGVNLCYAAFYRCDDPRKLIESLIDNVGSDRIEVDMLELSGPAFKGIDNRLTSLHLVQLGLTNAVMFSPDGEVLQPSEVLHKKAVLVERGSFFPLTRLHIDMLACATARFGTEPMVRNKEIVILMELTINNLLSDQGTLDPQDFLARVDLLSALGHTVLISNYSEFHRLTTYFRRYTKEMIGVAMGINTLLEVFNEKYYDNLQGGMLEAVGRLFRYAVKLYIYPMPGAQDGLALITADNVKVAPHLRLLYAHLHENHFIEALEGYKPECLGIVSRDVLARIKRGDTSWKNLVPEAIASAIETRRLFGWSS